MCTSIEISNSDLIAIFTALIVLIVGFYTIRIQIISSIQNQLNIKANICNNFIDPQTQASPINTPGVSAILSALLFGKEFIDLNMKSYWIFLYKCKQKLLIDFFYLQLHTSIIELIKANTIPVGVNDWIPEIQDQHKKCKNFFSESLNRYKEI